MKGIECEKVRAIPIRETEFADREGRRERIETHSTDPRFPMKQRPGRLWI
jgi:hypothetical protein